ncbi:MAG TPA: nucleotide-binding protein [Candidatus Methanoperedens sp.]|jgi:DNA/RNA endonuclease YhcR with UshA esterase domain
MMQKEEKIVVVLLVMAVLSLIIGYFGFAPVASAYSPDSKVGEKVSVEGTIIQKQMTAKGDNLILKISIPGINSNINVYIAKNNGAKEVYDTIKKDDKVKIDGKVAEFNNAREIVVESANDVRKL